MTSPISHTSSPYKHIAEEACTHAIWHHVGHVVGLSGYAAGILGGLLSFQTLGGKEEVYIPQPVNKPRVAKCISANRTFEDCLILPNGKEVVGQDLIRFYGDLNAARLINPSRLF